MDLMSRTKGLSTLFHWVKLVIRGNERFRENGILCTASLDAKKRQGRWKEHLKNNFRYMVN